MTFTAIHLLHAALLGANALLLAELAVSRSRLATVPACYFALLALSSLAAFFPVAQPGFPALAHYAAEALLPAASFLLMLQFLWRKAPAWPYWIILALPVVGGASTLYVASFYEEFCLGEACWPASFAFSFYHLLGGSLVLLLFMAILARGSGKTAREQYWLLIALVLTHVLDLAAELAQLGGWLLPEREAFLQAMLRVTFVYLAATSVFRVFHKESLPLHLLASAADAETAEAEARLARRFTALMEEEKRYRTHGLSRAAVAEMLGVKEYALSRAVNRHLGAGFQEIVNRYRVEEAKARLAGEPGMAVTVIAFEVGFASIPSFNRVFRECCGCSPSQFRSNAQGRGIGRSARPSHS